MSERKQLPLIPTESLCSSCTGACCRRGTTMTLTHAEADFLEENGADLGITDLRAQRTKDNELKYYFYIWDDCPFLKQMGSAANCSIHEDDRRPGICADFEQGSRDCLGMRDPNYIAPRRPPNEADFMM